MRFESLINIRIKQFSRIFVLLFFIFLPASNLISQKIHANTNNALDNNFKTPSYKLGPGDTLYMKISNVEGFEANVRIIPDGTVSLPRIGQINFVGIIQQNKLKKLYLKSNLRNSLNFLVRCKKLYLSLQKKWDF